MAPAVSSLWIAPVAFAAVAWLASREAGAVSPSSGIAAVVALASEKEFTARQDSNPTLGLMHVTEATALLDAARRMAPDHDIARACGVDVSSMHGNLEELRRDIIQALSED